MKIKSLVFLVIFSIFTVSALPAQADADLTSANINDVLASVDITGFEPSATDVSRGESLIAQLGVSVDPDALLSSLTIQDVKDIKYVLSGIHASITEAQSGLLPARTKSTVVTSNCSYATASATVSNVFGLPIGSFDIQGSWCTNMATNQIYSATLVSTPVTYVAPGYQVVGPLERGSMIMNNQARFWGEYQFILQVGPIIVSNPTLCGRLVGAADGHAWSSLACGAY